jgi:hypothetical protein
MIIKGINHLLVGSLIGSQSLIDQSLEESKKRGLIDPGDYVVVTIGINECLEESTNLLRILQV